MGDEETFEEKQQDDGRRQVNVENESFDVAIGVRDENGHFFPLSLTPGSGTFSLDMILKLLNQAGVLETAECEDGGTMRNQALLWDFILGQQIRAAAETVTGEQRTVPLGWDGAALIRFLTEAAGDLRVSNLGWDGAALARILLEATGEQRIAPVGTDEAGNLDNFRTDPNRIPWQRPFEDHILLPPTVTIPQAEGILWNPGLAAAQEFLVEFLIVNTNVAGAAVPGVYVGRDEDAGGALAITEYWMYDEVIPYPGTSAWRGPFVFNGDDAIRAVQGAGAANVAAVHFRIRRVDVGA